MGQSVLRTSHGVKVETKAACVELECFSSSIIRVKKYPLGQAPEKQSLSVTMQPKKVKYKIQEANNQVILTTSELTVLLDIIQNQVRFATKDGKELLAEKPSSTGFTSFSFRLRHGSICTEQRTDGYEPEPLRPDGEHRH